MQLSLYTWNGNAINDGTNYTGKIPFGQIVTPEAGAVWVKRAYSWPYLSATRLFEKSLTISIHCLGTVHSQRETIKQWFDTSPSLPVRTLVVRDSADSNRQWYLKARPTRIVEQEPGLLMITLALHEPYWRTVTAASDSWSITASGQTHDLSAVLGNEIARPIFQLTPTVAKTGGYAYKRSLLFRNNKAVAFPTYSYIVTGDVLDTATLVTAGKMQADGDDIRPMIDGAEVYRWLAGMNTASTKIWCNIDLSPRIELTLSGNIANTGAVATINVKETQANYNALVKLKSVANKVVMIDSEAFIFTTAEAANYRLTGCTRAQKFTSMAAHTDGATIFWIEHDAYLMYGNSTVSAPETDSTKEPMLDKTNSTNTSWVYTDYYDNTASRPAAWSGEVISSARKSSKVYTADHATDANPASEMGMQIAATKVLDVWRAETAKIVWMLDHPAGITTVSCTGEKYRYTASWPGFSGLQKSSDMTDWINVWDEATPGSVQTWTAFTQSGVTLSGTYRGVRLQFHGSVSAAADNLANFEVDAVTVAVDDTKTPTVWMSAEQDNYWLEAKITNVTTGEWIKVKYPVGLNRTLTLDCDTKRCYYDDGASAIAAVEWSTDRDSWLDLQPGANTLQFDDTGTNAVTLVTGWEHRAT